MSRAICRSSSRNVSVAWRFESYSPSFLLVAEGRSRPQVQPTHLSADQTLDMAAKARLSGRTLLDRDGGVLASSLECSAAEVSTIVDMQSSRRASDRLRL